MNRPYIICHMVTSIDGKVTGDFLFRKECENATEIYYDINRKLKCNGFICGRITMEESFTNGYYPDLPGYKSDNHDLSRKNDYIPDAEHMSGFYAVAFDTHGKLFWKSNKIVDEDVGYDGAQVIEVLSEQVDECYLQYLRELDIPYIFAGEKEIDVAVALKKLKSLCKIETLLLEGGSVINGAFEKADAIDELSLVVAPVVADKDSKPLFYDSNISDYELIKSENKNGVLILNYKKIS